MNFGKLITLGVVLAVTTPFALADTITTTGVSASSGVTTTGFTFGNKITTGPNTGDASGTVKANGTGVFSAFTTGQSLVYTPQISGSPAFKFTTPNSSGMLFDVIVEGGVTLDVYLTSILTHTVGSVSTPESFTASGFFTENGGSQITFDSFTLADNSNGALGGGQAFTTTLVYTPPVVPSGVTPEPGSLALLGTGVMGLGGLFARKRRVL
jgi:hypothetical protein